MLVPLNSLEEWREHYQGCFFRIQNGEEMVTIQAGGREGSDRFYFSNFSTDGNDVVEHINDSFHVNGSTLADLTYPSLGLINTPTDVRHISREPSRQWRKAYRTDGLIVKKLQCTKSIETIYRMRGRIAPLISNDKQLLTYYVFKDEYFTLDEAINQLLNGGERISVALNSRYAISLNINNVANFTVYYKDNIIGLLNKETRVMQLLSTYTYLMSDLRFSVGIDNIEILDFVTLSDPTNEEDLSDASF